MEAVVDTNVIVSGLLTSQGNAAVILQMVASGELILVYDDRVLYEYETVLKRDKFGLPESLVGRFLVSMRTLGKPVMPLHRSVALPDPMDLCFYECALVTKGKILITGNKRHFPGSICGGVKVHSPSEFLAALI